MRLKEYPKVELHYHLDGGVRPETIMEIAEREGIILPANDLENLIKYLKVSDDNDSLISYLEKFELPIKCMQSGSSLKQIAYEAVVDSSKQNVKYIEVRFAPLFHIEKLSSAKEAVEFVLQGIKKGEEVTGTIARLILICLRDHGVERNMEVVELAGDFKDSGVVAVDLAGNEKSYPAKNYRELFKKAKDLGLNITIHAGEGDGPESVRDAIYLLKANRIGHGVRSVYDENLLDEIKLLEIPLEICVTSNFQTKAVHSLKEHPIRKLLDMGIKVTLNTDNTTVSGVTITDEFELMEREFEFTMSDFEKVVMNAIDSSFVSKEVKEKIKKDIQNIIYNDKVSHLTTY
ncbi:MAG: adenosine deaminase [Clostridiales bacterium]|nr:adenosine deaminase [Clostridiales bacterium]